MKETIDLKKGSKSAKRYNYSIKGGDWLTDNVIQTTSSTIIPSNFWSHNTAEGHIWKQENLFQILNHNENHWMTISSVGATVNAYDSINLQLTDELERIFADLIQITSK